MRNVILLDKEEFPDDLLQEFREHLKSTNTRYISPWEHNPYRQPDPKTDEFLQRLSQVYWASTSMEYIEEYDALLHSKLGKEKIEKEIITLIELPDDFWFDQMNGRIYPASKKSFHLSVSDSVINGIPCKNNLFRNGLQKQLYAFVLEEYPKIKGWATGYNFPFSFTQVKIEGKRFVKVSATLYTELRPAWETIIPLNRDIPLPEEALETTKERSDRLKAARKRPAKKAPEKTFA